MTLARPRGRLCRPRRKVVSQFEFLRPLTWPVIPSLDCGMRKKWTLAAAFGYFGAVPKNPRWSWSGRSSDGKVVVLTMWEDQIGDDHGLKTYQSGPRKRRHPGAAERLENLIWARDRCERIFRVVRLRAKDAAAKRRSIAECFPDDSLIMRVDYLDDKTGEFQARQLSGVG
jgi:hypothetical protein